MKKFKRTQLLRLVALSLGVGITLGVSEIATALTLQSISNNVEVTMTYIAEIMQAIALISGIGFILASFFKFNQHKNNPQQIPLSNGLTLLVIGAALCLFPTLIPTATSLITGTTSTGSIAKLNGSGLSQLITG